ncbi:MAG TPA: deoxyribonuclease V [Burkholderiales bacterium]|nr:deoxyribonuclease V [Burkholderiales bacterium]
MEARHLHRWDLTPKEAMALQERLRSRVVRADRIGAVRRVAGVDVGFEQEGQVTRAAVAVLDFPGLELVERAVVRVPTRFPYVPGLLSFREAPAVLAAFEKVSLAPDLILYDGQGIAHPRRFGIASHVGWLLDCPSIGVAKTRLIGVHGTPANRRGAWTPLRDAGEGHGAEIIGAVLRTRVGVKPLYVSIGNRVSLETAVRWTMACVTRYRLPETTRWAHRLASVG